MFISSTRSERMLIFPVSFLFKVWELSDIDHDGMLDRDEFAVVSNLMLLKS